MGRLSIDIPMNLEKIEPKTSPVRRKATGSSCIQISEPKTIILNYLKTSTGSCHDFCKYSPVKPWLPVGRKLDKNVNVVLEDRSDNDQRGRSVSTSPKLLKPKTFGTNAFRHQSELKQPNRTFLKSWSKIQESQNDAGKGVKTSNTSKRNNFLPPLKAPQSEMKNPVKKTDTERTSYENVPEKIIHVIEPKDENRNKIHSSSNQNQKLNSTSENSKNNTIMGPRVFIPEEKDSPPKKLKFRRGTGPETENRNGGSIDKSLGKLVSDVRFIHKRDNNKRCVLQHQTVERENKSSALLNTVLEERASKLVKIRKSKVMALVGAFESVIEIQDSKSSRTCRGF